MNESRKGIMKNSWLRYALALIVGLFAGSGVNMGLITLGNSIIPLPAGADTSTTEGLRQAITMFGPEHYVFPWLGHAVGTFIGVLIAVLIQRSNVMIIPIIITSAYLIGGITMVMQIPSPLWFDVIDLVGAYLPMGYLGYRITRR
ncbi:MAG: hypothetical protein ACK45E_09310 [Ignavibacteria bacterium]|jgi:hypothetical protein